MYTIFSVYLGYKLFSEINEHNIFFLCLFVIFFFSILNYFFIILESFL